jgi:hypothetical protein
MTIRTKLHELKLTAKNEPLVDAMYAAPKFFISDEVFQLLWREDCQRVIVATIAAGIARLPYNPLLIEFHVPETRIRHFCLLTETDAGFDAQVASLSDEKHDRQEAIIAGNPTQVKIVSSAPDAVAFEMTHPPLAFEMTHWLDETNAQVVTIALGLSFLMLNTRGIDKQVIQTDKLNRARAAKRDGRPPIPQHTVIHIGTVYDRAGKGHSYDQTGKHMPVHLRSGYVRGQWFGKNREDYKKIFIPPCIVNYRVEDADHPPRLPEKEVRV